jgi:hypothetical protein
VFSLLFRALFLFRELLLMSRCLFSVLAQFNNMIGQFLQAAQQQAGVQRPAPFNPTYK